MQFLTGKTRGLAAALAVLMLLLAAAPSRAQEGDGESRLHLYEPAIKAGLVYNFLKYTDWPGGEPKSLRVCLLGDGPLGAALRPLAGRTAQQAVISVTRIGGARDAAGCNLLFVDHGGADGLAALRPALEGSHVLTVSDIDGFAKDGGMVEMATENDRIVLYINQAAVARAGLKIAGRMLKLGKAVPG